MKKKFQKDLNNREKKKKEHTVPQLTKYERILSIFAWLILFWFSLHYIKRLIAAESTFFSFFSFFSCDLEIQISNPTVPNILRRNFWLGGATEMIFYSKETSDHLPEVTYVSVWG